MSSDNEDNLIVPDAGINALEDGNNYKEIVQNLQNRQIQIKVVYRSDDKPGEEHNTFTDNSPASTSKATKRFIMSNHNARLPSELKKNLRIVGKNSEGTNKNVAPMNTLKKAPEILKSLSLTERVRSSRTTTNNNECNNMLLKTNNNSNNSNKDNGNNNNKSSSSTTKFVSYNPMLKNKVITVGKNKVNLIKASENNKKEGKEIEPPLSSLLDNLKSTGTQISLVKTPTAKNIKQQSQMNETLIDEVIKSKIKNVRVMLRRVKTEEIQLPIKNKAIAKKSCFKTKKPSNKTKSNRNTKHSAKLSTSTSLTAKSNAKKVASESASAAPSSFLLKSGQSLPAIMRKNDSAFLNNHVQIKVLPNTIKNTQTYNNPTTTSTTPQVSTMFNNKKTAVNKRRSTATSSTPKASQKCVEVQTEYSFEGICGLVDSKNFFINCFYCSAFYHFENWPEFFTHIRFEHQIEENTHDHTDHTYAIYDEDDNDVDEFSGDIKNDEDYYLNEHLNGNENKLESNNELHNGENDLDEMRNDNDVTMKKDCVSLMDTNTNVSLRVQILKSHESQVGKTQMEEQQQQAQSMNEYDDDNNDDDKDSIDALLKILNSPEDEQHEKQQQSQQQQNIKRRRNGRQNKKNSKIRATNGHPSHFTEIDKDQDGDMAPQSDDDNQDNNENNEYNDTTSDKDNEVWKFEQTLLSDDGVTRDSNQFAGFDDGHSDNDNDKIMDGGDGEDSNQTSRSQKNKVSEPSDDEMPSNDENEDETPKPTAGCGILFGLTNRAVCEEFLKNLALFPILYSPDVECTRNTYDVYITKMCVYLNRKFLLGITDLEMRHSIQRVNDWYARTMYKIRQHEKNSPNEPFVHRFPHYFEMCKVFLPKNHLPHKLVDGEGAQFKRHNQRRVYPPWVKTRIEDIKKTLSASADGAEESVLGLPEVTIDDVRQFLIKKNKIKTEDKSDIANVDSWQEIRTKAIKAQKNKSWERIKPAEQGEFRCDVCGREYTLWKKFRAHKYTHQPPKFKCDLCDKMFTRNYFRQKHIEAVHMASKPKAPKIIEPKVQSQTASGERPEFKCDECDKVYYKMASLKDHKQRHAPPRYQCEKCKKMFHTSSSLINHEQSSRCHQQPHICEYCGKAIYSRSTFRIHKKTKHLNIRQWYTCVVCNHKSQSKRYLIHHQQRHHPALEGTLEQLARKTNPQGMRLVHFSEEYRKGYLWRNSLRRPGIKVYSCLTCHVTFERYKDVLHHNKEKHPIRHGTYECQLCPPPGKLLMRSSLRRHYTVIHKVPIEELEMVLSRTKPVLPPSNSDANSTSNSNDIINNTFNARNDTKLVLPENNKGTTQNIDLETLKCEQLTEVAKTDDLQQEQMKQYQHKEEVEVVAGETEYIEEKEFMDDNDFVDENDFVSENGFVGENEFVEENDYVDEEFNESQYMLEVDEHDREVKEAVDYVENCMIESDVIVEGEEEQAEVIQVDSEVGEIYVLDNFDFLVEEIIESNDDDEEGDKKPEIYVIDE